MTPSPTQPILLTINGGSSSIKFALYTASTPPQKQLTGEIENIGTDHATLTSKPPQTQSSVLSPKSFPAPTHQAAVTHLVDFLNSTLDLASLHAIGHRIVHGGPTHLDPELVTPDLLKDLHDLIPLDPDHLPEELALLSAFAKLLPQTKQVACFDTAFFKHLPTLAKLLPIPRQFADAGVHRYGFHGLSYTYLMQKLQQDFPAEAHGKIILAHLGSGASITAVRDGQPIDTSMSFTPTAGLVMGTRTGDLDPALILYFLRKEKLTPDQIDTLINQKSGLLGISNTTADMRKLHDQSQSDPRSADAINAFCYSVTKYIGAYTAALNGLDTLVFSGGIGEHDAAVRAQICQNLTHLGLSLEEKQNANHAPLISAPISKIKVRVIPTDEEQVIATETLERLKDKG